MKKILTITLTLVVAFTLLSACGYKEEAEPIATDHPHIVSITYNEYSDIIHGSDSSYHVYISEDFDWQNRSFEEQGQLAEECLKICLKNHEQKLMPKSLRGITGYIENYTASPDDRAFEWWPNDGYIQILNYEPNLPSQYEYKPWSTDL